MSDEITPALTADEAKAIVVGSLDRLFGQVNGLLIASREYPGERLAAARDAYQDTRRALDAAFQLHGQPFGFTRADVEVLRAVARAAERFCFPNPRQKLDGLADRLAALLPPEQLRT